MRSTRSGILVVLALVGGQGIILQAQAPTSQAQAIPTNCWGCGDIFGSNPDQCFFGPFWEFGQSAVRCNTVWDESGSHCDLVGQLCGNPFLIALDGSAASPASMLERVVRKDETGIGRDCTGRIVLRQLMVSIEPSRFDLVAI